MTETTETTELRTETMNAGLGAVLGALAGDAAGAVLEFLGRAPKKAEVEQAMTMPGGGVWQVAPGQITDDGELAMCLLRSLAAGGFDADRVAASYVSWFDSPPFDIGRTTSSALLGWRRPPNGDTTGAAAGLRRAASSASMGSKANGSMMRAAPLGAWGWRLDDDALAEVARADSSLTHPNASACDAVAAYCVAIAALVRKPGDRVEAFGRAKAWLERHGCVEVKEWMEAAEANRLEPYHPQAGFVKIAFIHAFRHLKNGSGYVEAIAETLLGGGDTDTNACIVGGLIGAAVGAEGIPAAMRKAVIESDHTKGRSRPAFLHPRDVAELVKTAMGG